VPDLRLDGAGTQLDLPGGVIQRRLTGVKPITKFGDEHFRDGVTENVTHAWYAGTDTKHPFEGETNPAYSDFDAKGKYSWIKAPRFQGKPMQVGPLADVLVGYALKHAPTVKWVSKFVDVAGTLDAARPRRHALHARAARCARHPLRDHQ
jgi:hydrogenase large subunit